MIKILNKMLLFLKNILLLIVFILVMYILVYSFKRLDKNIFNNLMEFILDVLPFLLLMILNMLNISLKQDDIKDNLFYNITSFVVMLTIFIFCLRTLNDKNMYFWHKYDYQINFNYFSDQFMSIKLMLYGLSISNFLLMLSLIFKNDKSELKKISLT